LRSWTNLYAFLSQIMPFIDSEFEKFYAYAKLLQTRLPKRELSESLHLDDEVALEYYRLQKIKEGSIELQKGEEGELSGTSEAGLKRAKRKKLYFLKSSMYSMTVSGQNLKKQTNFSLTK
jgi:type I restriction enzyme, R subunit